MCGITGIVNINGDEVSSQFIQKMTDEISHRGPDGEGQWVERNIGLGHRRLSVLDLSSAGDQPMVSQDGRWVLTYNGEIYNYKEIRQELKTEGVYFRSNTDTEVVLYSLALWGEKALLKFNGMFALALWDRKNHELLVARDRYGIKPIYYSLQGEQFIFGSEQKAIIAKPGFKKLLNKQALLEYMTFQNIFTNQTLLQNIFLLEAGHFLKLTCKNNSSLSRSIRKQQYWDYKFKENEERESKDEYLEELDRLFKQAVHRQLLSDVELGSYLSGGIDSGSITCIAAKKFPCLKSFTCGFDLSSASGIELTFDERIKAEAMSAKFQTEHYEMVLKAGDMERCLSQLAWHLEEPRVGQSYPNFYIAKLASKFVKVVLSGSGGDELFGGYPWRYYRAANCQSFDDYINEYYTYWQRLLNKSEIEMLFKPCWGLVKDVDTKNIFKEVFSTHKNDLEGPKDFINHSLYFEAKTFLHGLFVVEDKLSMAHSLENRVPFMDNDLVDFAMKCPVSLKLNNLNQVLSLNENEPSNKKRTYFKKTNDGKQIVREMMEKYIDKDITRAEKKGFSSPDASWFKGQSIDFVHRTLYKNKALIFEILDENAIKSFVDDHLQGRRNRRLLIWSLLNLEYWLQSTF